jgi:hypothetical protein
VSAGTAGAATDRTYELVTPDDSLGQDIFAYRMSPDGARVALSTAAPLSSLDTDGGANDIYLRANGQTLFASPGGDSAGAMVHVLLTANTPDLSHVVLTTAAPLLPGDTDAARDIYEYVGGQLRQVSPGNGPHDAPFAYISDEGNRIFFATDESLLPGEDPDTIRDVYMRFGDQLRLMSYSGSAGNATSDLNYVSPEGRLLMTTGEPLIPGDSDADFDVFERFGEAVRLISAEPATGPATFVSASSDGTKVVYAADGDRPPDDTDGKRDLYLRDGAETLLVTPNTSEDMFFGLPSADGTHVIFVTSESLDPADTDSLDDVYDWSRTGVALVSGGGIGAPFAAETADVSRDGTRVWFSTAEAMTPDDHDGGARDVYERSGGQTRLISGGDAALDSRYRKSAEDGSRALFTTRERLTADDTDDSLDLYERVGDTITLVSPQAGGTKDPQVAQVSSDGRTFLFGTDDRLSPLDTDSNVDVYISRVPEPAAVPVPGFGVKTLVDLLIPRKGLRPSRRGVVTVRVRNRNGFDVDTALALRSRRPIATARRRVVKFGRKHATVAATKTTRIKLRVPRRSLRTLRRRKRVKAVAIATLTDPRGQRRTVTKRFALRARRPAKR